MRKEILHERALIKVNWRDFRGKTTERLYFTSLAANQLQQWGLSMDEAEIIAERFGS